MQTIGQKVVFFLAYVSVDGKAQGHVTSRFILTEEQVNRSDSYDLIIKSIEDSIKTELGFDIFITAFNRLN